MISTNYTANSAEYMPTLPSLLDPRQISYPLIEGPPAHRERVLTNPTDLSQDPLQRLYASGQLTPAFQKSYQKIRSSVEWLVAPPFAMPLGSIVALTGDVEVGKSLLTSYLAVCIAKGKDFLGNSVKQGRVVVANFENQQHIWEERIYRIAWGPGVDPLLLRGLIVPVDFFGGNLDNADNQELLRKVVEEVSPRLIVLDGQQAAFPGNVVETQRSSAAHEFLRTLISADRTLVTIKHTPANNPNAGKPSGNSFERNFVHANFSMTTQGKAGGRRLQKNKNNLYPDPVQIDFRMIDGTDESGNDYLRFELDKGTFTVEMPRHNGQPSEREKLRNAVIEVLEAAPEKMIETKKALVEALMDNLGWGRSKVEEKLSDNQTLEELEAQGRIQIEPIPGRGSPKRYSLVE